MNQLPVSDGPVIVREDDPAIRRIAVKLTPLAIAALVQNLVDKATTPTEKRKSAELILAYGWGRPVATTIVNEKDRDRVVIDMETQTKINETFDRINHMMNQGQISSDAHKIIDPILELEHMLETDEKTQL